MIGKHGFSRQSETDNIDKVIDMIIDVQKENGIKTNMREALYDPKTMERINKFKRRRLEQEGIDLTEYGSDPVQNNSSVSNEHKSNIERGVFVFNEADLIDEEEGEYICENCFRIGSACIYKPDICDLCQECYGCSEAINGTCDGCSFSTCYNGGLSYGQATNMEVEMSPEETLLFDDIIDGEPDYEKEKPTGHFTVLDY